MYKIKKVTLNRSRLLTGTYKTVWSIVRAVLLIGLSFIILYPLIYMVSISFRPLDELFDPSVVWIPKHLTLKNIKFAMEKMLRYPDNRGVEQFIERSECNAYHIDKRI